MKTLTIKEVAKYFGVKVQTLKELEPITLDREKIVEAYKKWIKEIAKG